MKASCRGYGFAEPKPHPTALGPAEWPASASHIFPIRMPPAGAPISHALAERSRTFHLAGIAHAGKGDPIRFLIRVCAAILKTATYSLSPCSPSVQQFSAGAICEIALFSGLYRVCRGSAIRRPSHYYRNRDRDRNRDRVAVGFGCPIAIPTSISIICFVFLSALSAGRDGLGVKWAEKTIRTRMQAGTPTLQNKNAGGLSADRQGRQWTNVNICRCNLWSGARRVTAQGDDATYNLHVYSISPIQGMYAGSGALLTRG